MPATEVGTRTVSVALELTDVNELMRTRRLNIGVSNPLAFVPTVIYTVGIRGMAQVATHKESSRKKPLESWRPICPPQKLEWTRVSDLSPELMEWARRNPDPRPLLDGSLFMSMVREFGMAARERDDGLLELKSDPPGLAWRRERGRCVPVVRGRATGKYETRRAYLRAVQTQDPNTAPHTALRGLRTNPDALLFLREFGALDKKQSEDDAIEINLADLWRRKALYAHICGIWDALINDERLRYAWRQLAEWIDDINVLDDKEDFFDARKLIGEPVMLTLSLSEQGGEETSGSDVRILLTAAKPDVLKGVSHELVIREMRKYASGQASRYMFNLPDSTPIFAFASECKSLWETVWTHFALDTQNGIIWRVCPHCGKVFRPARRERFFCTAELQREHTKSVYEAARKQRRRASRPG